MTLLPDWSPGTHPPDGSLPCASHGATPSTHCGQNPPRAEGVQGELGKVGWGLRKTRVRDGDSRMSPRLTSLAQAPAVGGCRAMVGPWVNRGAHVNSASPHSWCRAQSMQQAWCHQHHPLK